MRLDLGPVSVNGQNQVPWEADKKGQAYCL